MNDFLYFLIKKKNYKYWQNDHTLLKIMQNSSLIIVKVKVLIYGINEKNELKFYVKYLIIIFT